LIWYDPYDVPELVPASSTSVDSHIHDCDVCGFGWGCSDELCADDFAVFGRYDRRRTCPMCE
jgi:hypothetical protein